MIKELLFAEPSFTQTGVWCDLNPAIDPAEWAYVCRAVGKLNADQFEALHNKFKRNTCHNTMRTQKTMPLVSIGPSGIGGYSQNES